MWLSEKVPAGLAEAQFPSPSTLLPGGAATPWLGQTKQGVARASCGQEEVSVQGTGACVWQSRAATEEGGSLQERVSKWPGNGRLGAPFCFCVCMKFPQNKVLGKNTSEFIVIRKQ